MKLKVLSLFSGIGAFEKALKNVNVGVDLVNYCEIDKYASKAYSLIHNVSESMNLWDVTKVDTSEFPNDIDLLTYGFPCQDISICGFQRGFDHEGERTRSGLFFEALRIIEDTKPKFAICENVKNLTSNKFSNEFEIVLKSLESAGYKNYWRVLNARDYGIPQNRERVFIVSIRNDIDKGFEFPNPFPLELTLKDMLISGNVDRDVSLCITSRYCGFVGSQAYLRRRYFGKSMGQAVFENTTPEEQKEFWKTDPYEEFKCDGYVRRMFGVESFRLMGFDDQDAEILSENGFSEDNIQKLAGNSIVVDVLEEIYCELLNTYAKELGLTTC